MNEQLQQALAAILNKTVAGVEAGTNFLAAEIPEVIQQLLMWKLASSILGFAVCFALVCATAVLFRSIARGVKSGEGIWYQRYSPVGDLSAPAFLGGLIAAMANIPIWIIGFKNIGTSLQIWIAPKIYLIEYAASLAK